MSASGPARLSLGHRRHIRTTPEFERVRERGRRVVQGCLILNWMPLDPGMPSKIGVIASRNVGGAVIRNRARRLLRELFRLRQHEFRQAVAMVLVARNSIVGKAQLEVAEDFTRALRLAGLTCAKP